MSLTKSILNQPNDIILADFEINDNNFYVGSYFKINFHFTIWNGS